MKEKVSVLSLYSCIILPRFAVLLAVLAAGQSILFWLTMADANHLDGAFFKVQSGFQWMLATAFFLLCLLLAGLPGHSGSSRSDYTLARLRVTPRQQFGLRILFGTACGTLLMAFELAVLLGLCFWYEASPYNEFAGSQNIAVLCYRSNLLHSLLPMADWFRLIRNLVLLLCFGIVMAAAPADRRVNSKLKNMGLPIAFFVLMVAGFTRYGVGEPIMDSVVAGAAFFLAILAVIRARKEDDDEDDENEREA